MNPTEFIDEGPEDYIAEQAERLAETFEHAFQSPKKPEVADLHDSLPDLAVALSGHAQSLYPDTPAEEINAYCEHAIVDAFHSLLSKVQEDTSPSSPEWN